MATYRFVIDIEAKNEKAAKKEFSEAFGYEFGPDNFYEVEVIEVECTKK